MIKKIALAAIMLLLSATANALTKNWIVIGDSILSEVPDGKASQLSINLVSVERNVIFKNISAPGNSLGAKDHTGFNNDSTIESLKRIGGMYSYYQGIIIQAGTNDFGLSVPMADTLESLTRIMEFARKNKKKVLVLDPLWRANENTKNKLGLTLHHYRYVMTSACLNDFKDVCRVASRSKTIMGTSAGAAHYDKREVRGKVQLHPNPKGHRYMADWIKAEAKKAGFF